MWDIYNIKLSILSSFSLVCCTYHKVVQFWVCNFQEVTLVWIYAVRNSFFPTFLLSGHISFHLSQFGSTVDNSHLVFKDILYSDWFYLWYCTIFLIIPCNLSAAGGPTMGFFIKKALRTYNWKQLNIIMAWNKRLTASNSGLIAKYQGDRELKETL